MTLPHTVKAMIEQDGLITELYKARNEAEELRSKVESSGSKRSEINKKHSKAQTEIVHLRAENEALRKKLAVKEKAERTIIKVLQVAVARISTNSIQKGNGAK